jgi:hypothetical protein
MMEVIAFIGGFLIAILVYYILSGIFAGSNGTQPLSSYGMPPYMFHQHISQPFTEA